MNKQIIKINSLHRLVFFLLIFSFFQISCIDKKEKYISIAKENTNDIFSSTKIIEDANFIGSENCRECHKSQFEMWENSHHEKAMQMANRETILAQFEGETFKSQGITSRFFKKENDFYVNTEGPDGKYHDYKIIYSFGIMPLQQYIVQFPDGKYQCLRTAWDTIKNRWFDLYPDFKIVHSEWLHWSKGGLNWNSMCSDCHSTNVRKNYNENSEDYNTKFSVVNVSCEACHGPGKKHVEEVKSLGSKYNSINGYMQMTSKTSPTELVDQCARCHMRREQISEGFNFEGTMLDHYFPQLIESPVYHPDGQILDEDYVYGSFIQSKMYQNNVSCNNCHDSHSLKLKFDGNKLCFQCHESLKYDTTSHHFHEGIQEATKCINCHMTGKIYMGNDFRRDHSFRIPRPDLSIKYNTPNACTQCHTGKDNEWAWEAFKKQYGVPDYTHFSEKLAPGIVRDPNAHAALLELVRDHTQPEVARASAVKAISNYGTQNNIDSFIMLLNDESPLVRGATIDVLSEIKSLDFMSYLLPILKDKKRAVRIKAFYALGALPENQIPIEYIEAYKKVKEEFTAYLKINADFSGGQAKKASYYEKKGNLLKAKESYKKALKIDYNNNIVRSNLANLYYSLGETENSENTFREIIGQEPKFGYSYYSLALLLAELERIDDAIIEMENAYKLMPSNVKVIYNLSLLHEKKGNIRKAEKTLIEGLKFNPENEDLLYALSFHYLTHKQKQEALKFTRKIIKLYPNKPVYQNLMNKVENL